MTGANSPQFVRIALKFAYFQKPGIQIPRGYWSSYDRSRGVDYDQTNSYPDVRYAAEILVATSRGVTQLVGAWIVARGMEFIG
jgi:hypothetical protein